MRGGGRKVGREEERKEGRKDGREDGRMGRTEGKGYIKEGRRKGVYQEKKPYNK